MKIYELIECLNFSEKSIAYFDTIDHVYEYLTKDGHTSDVISIKGHQDKSAEHIKHCMESPYATIHIHTTAYENPLLGYSSSEYDTYYYVKTHEVREYGFFANKTKQMEESLNEYTITWVEFRPMSGIATKVDCKKMNFADHEPRQHNGYAYDYFEYKRNAIDYIKCVQFDIERRKLSKKYEVRLFTDAQFKSMDMSIKEKGKGYPVEFTNKQNEEMIILG